MSKDRRTFMIASGMAAGGAFVGSLSAAPQTSRTPVGEVNHVISQFGSTMESSKDAHGVTHLRVNLTDHAKLCDVLSSGECPFDAIKATSRNTLDFVYRGQNFSVSRAS